MQLNKDLMNKLYHATQQKEALEKQLEKETPSMFNYCLNSYVPNPNDIIDQQLALCINSYKGILDLRSMFQRTNNQGIYLFSSKLVEITYVNNTVMISDSGKVPKTFDRFVAQYSTFEPKAIAKSEKKPKKVNIEKAYKDVNNEV